MLSLNVTGIDYTYIGVKKGQNYTYQIDDYRIFENENGQHNETTSFELLPGTFVGQNDIFIITIINDTVWESLGSYYLDVYVTAKDYTVITYIQLGVLGAILAPIEWDFILPIWNDNEAQDRIWADELATRSSLWEITDNSTQIGFSYTNVENFTIN